MPPLLPFAQLDLPGKLGPGDGRYLIRPEGEPDADPDVLVLNTLGAPRAGAATGRLRRGRAREVESPPSAPPLPLTRATVIRPKPFDDRAAAERWLEEVCTDRELSGPLALESARRINRALHAHRTAAGDPHIADIEPGRAVAVRFGFGTGEEVADGRWQQARELPEAERRGLIRRDYEALRPQERVAAVLGGRERVGAHEELILRARGDLDAGRATTAALGLSAGLDALMAMPEGLPTAANELLRGRLEEARAEAREARDAVLRGGEPDAAALERALRAAETAVRQRALK